MDSYRRRDEIEKKKAKIAELKRTREERTKALVETQTQETQTHAQRRRELEALVASLVGDRGANSKDDKTPPVFAPVTASPPVPVISTPASILASPPDLRARPAPKLAMTSIVMFETAPIEKVYYEKEQQTVDSSFQTDDIDDDDLPTVEKTQEEFAAIEAALNAPPPVEKLSDATVPARVMDDFEREIITQSWQFQDFFDKSSKLVERALVSKFDTLADYTIGDEDRSKDLDTGHGVNSVCTFFDDRWTKSRSITDVSWSPRHPELVLAAYNKNMSSINDPDGVVLVWNTIVPDRPEFMFHAQSDITTACFSEFHPNLVIGGTYSGQILIWDNRQKSSAVLKTPLSAAGHTHPVFSMNVVGTQNAHSLITCSTDGTMCSWALDMLASPQEILELAHHPMDSNNLRPTNEIAVTTFGFPANETTTFWVGSEEGSIYQANRYDRAGGKAGINSLDTYIGHDGMITSIHFHPLNGSVDFSDLFLTSSVDWTVKLWKGKNPTKAATVATTPSKITPLYSFEQCDDFVYDAKWSPVHPAVFGCVDGTGQFQLYDLNSEVEVASASIGVSNKAINKLAWDKTGVKVALGASDGRLHVYDVGEYQIYILFFVVIKNAVNYSWTRINYATRIPYVNGGESGRSSFNQRIWPVIN
ncbi:hypothetical protein HK100_005848 [Physocladia obscura]|uniref:Uncharacterized protein n=1 Tax=Physocladia obscura TaxID=109957 RepID=A0AAD5SS21_9FUNG|nr:hypothetical protein HK100_005848 [Physocladia obscura]